MTIAESSPHDVFNKLSRKEDCLLIDVREDEEYGSVKVNQSYNIPLSRLREGAASLDRDKNNYLLCRSGRRAQKAASRLQDLGFEHLYVIKGGLDEWVKSKLPVEGTRIDIWSIERQVRFTAGVLVLIGIILSYSVNANWILVSALVALGMVVSALSGTCGMANVLQIMPWNCRKK